MDRDTLAILSCDNILLSAGMVLKTRGFLAAQLTLLLSQTRVRGAVGAIDLMVHNCAPRFSCFEEGRLRLGMPLLETVHI